MSVGTVSNKSNILWQQEQMTKKSNQSISTGDEFSKILQNMREYKPANFDDTIQVDDKTTVTTQVLSDGSTLTTVRKDGKIISQSKTPATHPENNPTVISTRTVKGTKQEDAGQTSSMVNPSSVITDETDNNSTIE